MKVLKPLCLTLFFILLSCTNSKNRFPASSDYDFSSFDLNVVFNLLDKALELDSRFPQDHFKILNHPVNDPSDLTNGLDFLNASYEIDYTLLINSYYNELNNFLKPYINQSEQKAKRQLHQYIKESIINKYSKEQRQIFTELSFQTKTAGEYMRLGSTLIALMEDYNFFVSEEEIKESIQYLLKPYKGVRYLGDFGWHGYSNKKLELHIKRLTLTLNTQKSHFIKVFDELSKQERLVLQTNSHGMSESAKVEPFDLLSTASTWYLLAKNNSNDQNGRPLNKIFIGKLVQKSLSRIMRQFELDERSDKLPTSSVLISENKVNYFCANGRFKTRETQGYQMGYNYFGFYNNKMGSDLLEVMSPNLLAEGFLSSNISRFTYTCNTMEYKNRIQFEQSKTINPPAPVDYSRRKTIRALVTVALVSELNFNALQLGRSYLSLFSGWEVVHDYKEVETLDAFNNIFPFVDVYIPVSHAMDVNRFDLGSSKGYQITLKKTVDNGNGDVKDVLVTLLLPRTHKDSHMVNLNPTDLSKLFYERSLNTSSPLVLLNTSCNSERTLFTWLQTYRKYLDILTEKKMISDYKEDHQLPHIIGSKRAFSTSSITSIMSHLYYPLGVLDRLAKNYSVPQVVEFLKKEKKKSFLSGITSLFSGDSINKEAAADGFDPDYVMDHPELLELSGFRLFVDRRGFKSTKEY